MELDSNVYVLIYIIISAISLIPIMYYAMRTQIARINPNQAIGEAIIMAVFWPITLFFLIKDLYDNREDK